MAYKCKLCQEKSCVMIPTPRHTQLNIPSIGLKESYKRNRKWTRFFIEKSNLLVSYKCVDGSYLLWAYEPLFPETNLVCLQQLQIPTVGYMQLVSPEGLLPVRLCDVGQTDPCTRRGVEVIAYRKDGPGIKLLVKTRLEATEQLFCEVTLAEWWICVFCMHECWNEFERKSFEALLRFCDPAWSGWKTCHDSVSSEHMDLKQLVQQALHGWLLKDGLVVVAYLLEVSPVGEYTACFLVVSMTDQVHILTAEQVQAAQMKIPLKHQCKQKRIMGTNKLVEKFKQPGCDVLNMLRHVNPESYSDAWCRVYGTNVAS